MHVGGKNKPWIFLKVHSRAPSEKSLPIFLGKETITGHVELDLVKTEHIQGISLTVSTLSPLGSESGLTAPTNSLKEKPFK